MHCLALTHDTMFCAISCYSFNLHIYIWKGDTQLSTSAAIYMQLFWNWLQVIKWKKLVTKYNHFHIVAIANTAWSAGDVARWMPSHFLQLQVSILSHTVHCHVLSILAKLLNNSEFSWTWPFLCNTVDSFWQWYSNNVCYAFLMELVTCLKIRQFSIQHKGDKHSASV